MSDYLKIEFENLSNDKKEVVIAFMSEMNYDGFEEEGDLLMAYISSDSFDEQDLSRFTKAHKLSFSVTRINSRNWNKEWESNFHPVVINHPVNNIPFIGVRADFHKPLKNVVHEIIITPKMSFGTGHHPTTSMMMQMISELDLRQKKVLDFGTGTGILAILSEKMGASKIIAIDNDDQSIENAAENFQSNNCTRIQLKKESSAKGDYKFDFIFANIIKWIIVENLPLFAGQLNFNGSILLSGLLTDDEKDVVRSALKSNLAVCRKIETNSWICLQMRHKSNIPVN